MPRRRGFVTRTADVDVSKYKHGLQIRATDVNISKYKHGLQIRAGRHNQLTVIFMKHQIEQIIFVRRRPTY
jgi:hypothetical protein